jgi:hypothetical protein
LPRATARTPEPEPNPHTGCPPTRQSRSCRLTRRLPARRPSPRNDRRTAAKTPGARTDTLPLPPAAGTCPQGCRHSPAKRTSHLGVASRAAATGRGRSRSHGPPRHPVSGRTWSGSISTCRGFGPHDRCRVSLEGTRRHHRRPPRRTSPLNRRDRNSPATRHAHAGAVLDGLAQVLDV